jgi:hypothetical protein
MKYKIIFLFYFILIFCVGCSRMRHVVPQNMMGMATIPGFKSVRDSALDHSPAIEADMLESLKQESPNDYMKNRKKVYPILNISGGGANGAYGAGILKGWSDFGTRPKFKAVTGISTGALIAPFAFLGSDYDDLLKKVYTTKSTKHIATEKGPLRTLFSDSLMSNKPLEKMIKKMVTDEMLEKIAEEHKRGRRLYIGTTNLDFQTLIIWNMGKIATIGGKKARKLFSKVLLASSSIPIAFPPQFFNVEIDGKKYDEMHVDGGAVAQVFSLYGVLSELRDKVDTSNINIDLYIIRNGYINPTYSKVNDNISSIANRSLDIMINTQGIGDLYRLYTLSKVRGHNYYLAYISPKHQTIADEMFDPDEMKRLFNRGYQEAKNGYPWMRKPPYLGLIEVE